MSNHKEWSSVRRRVVYPAQTPDEISFAIDRIRLPSGREFDYAYVDCPYEVVFTVGIDDRRRVLMIRQYRYLVKSELVEVPAGSPDPGESLEDGARREFEEESGYRAGDLHKLAEFYSSVGMTNQKCHVFLACALSIGVAKNEESEDVHVEWTPLEEAIALVRGGQVLNVGAAYGLLLADLWLRARGPKHLPSAQAPDGR